MNYPKTARVRKREDYLRFFEQSEVIRLNLCTVFKIQNKVDQARLGITVKSRVNSVYRNKFKRQIKEAFRNQRQGIACFDYNVVVPGQLKVNYKTPQKLRMILEQFWLNENFSSVL